MIQNTCDYAHITHINEIKLCVCTLWLHAAFIRSYYECGEEHFSLEIVQKNLTMTQKQSGGKHNTYSGLLLTQRQHACFHSYKYTVSNNGSSL